MPGRRIFDIYQLDWQLMSLCTGDVFFTQVFSRANVLGTRWLEPHLLHWKDAIVISN
jgi:hypothetical protein